MGTCNQRALHRNKYLAVLLTHCQYSQSLYINLDTLDFCCKTMSPWIKFFFSSENATQHDVDGGGDFDASSPAGLAEAGSHPGAR